MNRAARRAAAARARRLHQGARPGYLHRITAAHAALGDQLRGKLVHANIEHDGWCGIYKGRTCDCVPDISLHPIDGGDVVIVDEEGQTKKVAVS
jgi:hypothetical protein